MPFADGMIEVTVLPSAHPSLGRGKELDETPPKDVSSPGSPFPPSPKVNSSAAAATDPASFIAVEPPIRCPRSAV